MERRAEDGDVHSGWRGGPGPLPNVWGELAIALFALPFILLTGSTAFFGLLAGAVPLAIVAAAGFVIGIVLLSGGGRRRERRTRRLARLLEGDPADLSVRVTMRLAGSLAILGHDEGTLFTEDGWLVFRGRRTEWAVRPTDVDSSATRIRYPSPTGRRLDAEFLAITEPGRLGALLREWRATPARPGRAVFPPGRVAPERRSGAIGWAVWAVATVGAGAWAGAVAPDLRLLFGVVMTGLVAGWAAWRVVERESLRTAGALPGRPGEEG